MEGKPRIMIAAVSSGSGKTTITCGLLQALVNRKFKALSFKCGPDYIDPMFHSKVIGTKSRNIDSFFCNKDTLRYLMDKSSKDIDISVIEGVMGFFDGISSDSLKASSYEVSEITKTPVILVVNCRGMSRSVVPIIKGFKEYVKKSNIQGVILNEMPEMIYQEIKILIEQEIDVKVLGYVPKLANLLLESRHLGLVTPDEIKGLKEKLNELSNILEKTLDIDEIIRISKTAGKFEVKEPKIKKIHQKIKIGVARDEAFCFYYQDNLELLEEMGAEIEFFSPIRDKKLPDGISGLILGGGYPELYAKELSENERMKESIYNSVKRGLPTIAECGGFMYLHTSMEDDNGDFYKMVNLIEGKAYKTSKLNRFGYLDLEPLKDNFLLKKGEQIKGHEFHYWDSTNCGESFVAKRPCRCKSWNCINTTDNLFAGYPHVHYYSNLNFALNFLKKCLSYGGNDI